jgi:hypothetical protein
MTSFYRLKESNDNEGETWLYYFQAPQKVIDALAIVTAPYLEEYEFDKNDELDEDDVDFLVEHLSGIGGYKPLANKVAVDPAKVEDLYSLASNMEADDHDEEEIYEAVSDLLYKGSLFKRL